MFRTLAAAAALAILPAVGFGAASAQANDEVGFIIGPVPCPPTPTPTSACEPLPPGIGQAGALFETQRDRILAAAAGNLPCGSSTHVSPECALAGEIVRQVQVPSETLNLVGWALGVGTGPFPFSASYDGDGLSFMIGPVPCPPTPTPNSACEPLPIVDRPSRDIAQALLDEVRDLLQTSIARIPLP